MKLLSMLTTLIATLTFTNAQYTPDPNDYRDEQQFYPVPLVCNGAYPENQFQGLDLSDKPKVEQIETMLFDWPLQKFLCASELQKYFRSDLNWWDNGCRSFAPFMHKVAFDMSAPCYRQGFAMRNLRYLNMWNETVQEVVAAQFEKDLHSTCSLARLQRQREDCHQQAIWFVDKARFMGRDP